MCYGESCYWWPHAPRTWPSSNARIRTFSIRSVEHRSHRPLCHESDGRQRGHKRRPCTLAVKSSCGYACRPHGCRRHNSHGSDSDARIPPRRPPRIARVRGATSVGSTEASTSLLTTSGHSRSERRRSGGTLGQRHESRLGLESCFWIVKLAQETCLSIWTAGLNVDARRMIETLTEIERGGKRNATFVLGRSLEIPMIVFVCLFSYRDCGGILIVMIFLLYIFLDCCDS
jgi:hypothetical protein